MIGYIFCSKVWVFKIFLEEIEVEKNISNSLKNSNQGSQWM